jgi:hypothetical protein
VTQRHPLVARLIWLATIATALFMISGLGWLLWHPRSPMESRHVDKVPTEHSLQLWIAASMHPFKALC